MWGLFITFSTVRLQAQIHNDMLKNHWLSLKAWGEDEIPAVGGHRCERTGRLHVNVLELVERFALFIPQEDLCERVVASQGEVEPVCEGEGLEHHGSSRRQSL